MNPTIAPGINLTEGYIIDLITDRFGFADKKWVTKVTRKSEIVLARKILMKCLVDLLGYTLHKAGAVCNQSHCTAIYAKKMIDETYWNDKEYSQLVQEIYYRCYDVQRNFLKP